MPSEAVTRDRGAEHEILAVLRGERCDPTDPVAFVRAAERHGVSSLLVRAGAARWLPPSVMRPVSDTAVRHAATWVLRQRELCRIGPAIEQAGLHVLLVKGGHLALMHYADPASRECVDVDLFVRPAHRPQFVRLLTELGFTRCHANVGEAALGQEIFERPGAPGTTLDVHTRLLTAPALASRLGFEDLWRRSRPLAAIGGLRVPGVEDALELALLHQLVHHPGDRRLLWMYDVSLLLADMPDADAGRFADRLRSASLTVCRLPLLEAQQRFPTSAGAVIARSLASDGSTVDAAWMQPCSPLRRVLEDVRALPSWRARLRLVRGHLCPPADYMRQTYAGGSRTPLSVLYFLRVARGGWKWLRRR